MTVPVFVGDDLESARDDGELESVKLGVRVVQTGPNDTISFSINGSQLSLELAEVKTYLWWLGLLQCFPRRSKGRCSTRSQTRQADRQEPNSLFSRGLDRSYAKIPVELIPQLARDVGRRRSIYFLDMFA